MHRRINITLPENTIDLIDRVRGEGNRSAFIDEAVRQARADEVIVADGFSDTRRFLIGTQTSERGRNRERVRPTPTTGERSR